MGCFEWANNEFLHLPTEGLLCDIRACVQDLEQLLSEFGILVGKLEGECWENCLKIAPALKVSRAEEAGSKLSIREGRFSERLGNSRFSSPSQAIQPEDALVSFAR